MNRDEIINALYETGVIPPEHGATENQFLAFHRFAALVAAAERDRLLSASELCRVCEQRRIRHETTTQDEANS